MLCFWVMQSQIKHLFLTHTTQGGREFYKWMVFWSFLICSTMKTYFLKQVAKVYFLWELILFSLFILLLVWQSWKRDEDSLLVSRLECCCSSFRSFSQDSLTSVEWLCNVYLRREPLCSCHKPQDLSSPPMASFISTSFSWRDCKMGNDKHNERTQLYCNFLCFTHCWNMG